MLGKPQEEGNEELYVLKEGRVQLYVLIPDGGEVTLSVVEGGSIFGELALGGLRSGELYAWALVPSLVCSLKTEEVHQLIESNPKVGIALVLFTIAALDQPFSGGARIGPAAFELVLNRFETSKLSDL